MYSMLEEAELVNSPVHHQLGGLAALLDMRNGRGGNGLSVRQAAEQRNGARQQVPEFHVPTRYRPARFRTREFRMPNTRDV
jgi:hypothetical protein